MNFCHYSVHTPIQAPERLVQKYRDKAARLKLDQVDPFVEGDHFPSIHKSDQRIVRRVLQSDPTYAAMIENLDTNIGRVLQTLEDEGLADDTIVVFTSDNGGLATSEGSPTCNAPMAEGKGWANEGGIRVCQMIRWPGVTTPGSRTAEPVTSTDFYPTLLEAAGLPPMPDQHVDGVSMRPVLDASAASLDREAIYWHYPHYGNQGDTPSAAVLSGGWKLIKRYEQPEDLELYHLSTDVSEQTNRAATEPEIRERLHAMLQSWQAEVEARIPQPNPGWEKQLKRPSIANNAHV